MGKAIALYSGGKDSHYAVLRSFYQGIATEALITATPARTDSWLFHSVNISWCELHGEAMGVPTYFIPVSGVKGSEEEELVDGLARVLARHPDVDYLIVGAVRSRYQLEKFKALSEGLGLRVLAPFWGFNELELLKRELEELTFLVTAVQAYCLDFDILGTPLASEIYRLLVKAHKECEVSLVGEGGEFETFVIRSPLFKGTGIAVNKAIKILYPAMHTGYFIIENAKLM